MALFHKTFFSLAVSHVDVDDDAEPGVEVSGTDRPERLVAEYDVSQLEQTGVVPAATIPGIYLIQPIMLPLLMALVLIPILALKASWAMMMLQALSVEQRI